MVSDKRLLAPIFIFVPLIFVLYSCAVIDNNDFMYATAPVVWAQGGALYRDVPFVQAPLTIILNLGIMKVFSAGNIFVVSRILSIVLVLAAVLVSAFALRRVKDREFIILYILLCLINPFILSNSREMGSYSQPLFLIAAALALQTLEIAAWKRGLLVGITLGLALSAKLNFIIIAPAFLLSLLLEVGWSWSIVAWFCLGYFAGALPLIYYAAVDVNSLYERTIRFHHLVNLSRDLDPHKSVSEILASLLRFVELAAAPLGFLVLRLADQRLPERWRVWAIVLGFLGCSAVMATVAQIVFPQYLAPLALMILFFCFPDPAAPSEQKRAVWMIGVTLLVIQLCAVTYETIHLIRKQDGLAMLEVVRMQRRAEHVATMMKKCDPRLYSPEPLFLLNERVKYPDELGAGPFLLALRGGKLQQENLENVGVDIDARLKEWAPNLLIYGFYADDHNNFSELDEIVQSYATLHGFQTSALGVLDGRTVTIAYDKACI